MANYKELEARVKHFLDVRSEHLLITPGAVKDAGGFQRLVQAREESPEHAQYMAEVRRFLRPCRGSTFFEHILVYRLEKEFNTGYRNTEELYTENGTLLSDLGIEMNSSIRRGRFRFYSSRFAPGVEAKYFIKYGAELNTKTRIGIHLPVSISSWDEYLGHPKVPQKGNRVQPKIPLPVISV